MKFAMLQGYGTGSQEVCSVAKAEGSNKAESLSL